jgi:hypothetical protein
MPEDTRAAVGSVYKLTVEFLNKRGLMDKVKAKASPELKKLLEKPPFAFAWHSMSELEEIERILYTMADGSQLCADLGYAAASQLSGGMVEPVFRMAMSLFGKTPATLMGNLDRFYSMVVRGFSFEYEARSPKDGVVTAQIAGGGVHESLFQQIRGNLRIMIEICGAKGIIGEVEVMRHNEDGAKIRVPVRWE